MCIMPAVPDSLVWAGLLTCWLVGVVCIWHGTRPRAVGTWLLETYVVVYLFVGTYPGTRYQVPGTLLHVGETLGEQK
jgi:hypothetical protein